jgi:hypothetical protein
MIPAVLALIAQQQACDAAWQAWLADAPMSWLQGVRL